jgi:NAD(P)-dependent dehydrogenase (short-subunit alcohol dehydrogenase family)
VVKLSSGMGQLSEMGGGFPAYRVSEAHLNALTRTLASQLEGTGIKVNAACPGWVRTDMGGAGAARAVEEGVATTVWLATLPDDGPSGGCYRNRSPGEGSGRTPRWAASSHSCDSPIAKLLPLRTSAPHHVSTCGNLYRNSSLPATKHQREVEGGLRPCTAFST